MLWHSREGSQSALFGFPSQVEPQRPMQHRTGPTARLLPERGGGPHEQARATVES